MVTRAKLGVVKPNSKYALFTNTSNNVPHKPQNIKTALAHPDWKAAMNEELAALHQNKTWILFPRTPNMNVIGSTPELVEKFIMLLSSEFAMKDLGPIHHFLGMEITTTNRGLHLSQSHYTLTILERSSMVDCKPMSPPLKAKTKTSSNEILLEDPSYNRGLVGALQYLALTHPDISFSVNYVSQFMHTPTMTHLKMVRRILRYVKGTIEMGLHFSSHSALDLFAFSNAHWAGCPTTRRSTTGYCTFLGGNLISWRAKK
ncbi:uncharacterized protein LOC111406502 [Olea europaea var. sylvestris]|uniref:uncharacterized protein LOC111406502 n=1 Tax=Olea europaea var. sylvestris TaxID=158386 RepID=UPI000C1CE02F|nr:uncharacterized protein LOC111406502 [Olea europaea var. sylvestris]